MVLGKHLPEVACGERGEFWIVGHAKLWQRDAVTVVGEWPMFRPRLAPVA
jgi:hypothetical protein